MLVVSSLRTVLFNFVLSDRGEHYTRTTSNLEITAIHSLFYPNIPIYFFFSLLPFYVYVFQYYSLFNVWWRLCA